MQALLIFRRATAADSFPCGPEQVRAPVTGGGERDRTAGLDVANVALSQLSYTPWRRGL